MDKITTGLFFELITLGFLIDLLIRKPRITFFRPFFVLTLLGFAVEVGSILSNPSAGLLMWGLNVYTYPALTLCEALCLLWILSFFVKNRLLLLGIACFTLAAWIAAKLSFEPFWIFNQTKGKLVPNFDTTTFTLLHIQTLFIFGFCASKSLYVIDSYDQFKATMLIVGGFIVYAFVSLNLPALRPLFSDTVKVNLWWVNTAGFALKSACLCYGYWLFRQSPSEFRIIPRTVKTAHTLVMAFVLGGLYLTKYLFLRESVLEFAIICLCVGSAVIVFYTSQVFRLGLSIVANERAQRIVQEKLNIATQASTSNYINNLAHFLNDAHADAHTLFVEIESAKDENFKEQTSPVIRGLIETLKTISVSSVQLKRYLEQRDVE
jgi:hypothetical protein